MDAFKLLSPEGKIVVLCLIVQFVATQLTNAKRWSIQSMIRNVSIGLSIYQWSQTKNWFYLLIPFLLELMMEISNWTFIPIQPYLRTEYLYSDWFEQFVNKYKVLASYSEGSYSKVLNVDTSPENSDIFMEYGKKIYNQQEMTNKIPNFSGTQMITIDKVNKQAQNDKFSWIVNNCQIKPGTRILEIGFGKLDLMTYLKSVGADVVGINISSVQVAQAKKQGFNAVCTNVWNVLDYQKELGKFDLIIANGSFEYFLVSSDPLHKYVEIFQILKQLLKPNGRLFVTTLHVNTNFRYDLYDYVMCYLLWAGNDGRYPHNRDGLTKWAKKAGFNVLKQENRWLDYYLFTVIWLKTLCQSFSCKKIHVSERLLKAIPLLIADPHFIQSHLCYTPTENIRNTPWAWQFIQQKEKGKLAPITHEWIIFQI